MTTRTCTRCHADKPITDFYKYSGDRKLMAWCKTCHNARTTENERRRKLADPEGFRAKRIEYQRRYREPHRDAVRARQRARRAKARDRRE